MFEVRVGILNTESLSEGLRIVRQLDGEGGVFGLGKAENRDVPAGGSLEAPPGVSGGRCEFPLQLSLVGIPLELLEEPPSNRDSLRREFLPFKALPAFFGFLVFSHEVRFPLG
jgi:hypothetical protein